MHYCLEKERLLNILTNCVILLSDSWLEAHQAYEEADAVRTACSYHAAG